MNRYVITGGCGFIGSNFIRMLMRDEIDAQIINIDKMTYAASNSINSEFNFQRNYKFVLGDICDSKFLQDIICENDIVINFAAESHVDKSIENPDIFLQTNVYGVNSLINTCLHVKIKKFIQISTDEVYGSLHKHDRPRREDDCLNPSSPYSASKAAAEMLCISAFRTYGLPICITRSSNNYGPYQFAEKIIPLFIKNLLMDKKVPLYGNGKNIRDWIHVEDNCRGIKKVVDDGKIGEIYNIGGQNQVDNYALTNFILEFLEKDTTYIEFVTDRLGHDFRYDINSSKIRQLGWLPNHIFRDGLKNTIEWYKNNRWFFGQEFYEPPYCISK